MFWKEAPYLLALAMELKKGLFICFTYGEDGKHPVLPCALHLVFGHMTQVDYIPPRPFFPILESQWC